MKSKRISLLVFLVAVLMSVSVHAEENLFYEDFDGEEYNSGFDITEETQQYKYWWAQLCDYDGNNCMKYYRNPFHWEAQIPLIKTIHAVPLDEIVYEDGYYEYGYKVKVANCYADISEAMTLSLKTQESSMDLLTMSIGEGALKLTTDDESNIVVYGYEVDGFIDVKQRFDTNSGAGLVQISYTSRKGEEVSHNAYFSFSAEEPVTGFNQIYSFNKAGNLYTQIDYFAVDDVYLNKTSGNIVNFNTNKDLIVPSRITSDGKIELPEPVYEGFEFAGWFKDEACTVPFDGTGITEDMTVHAKWYVTYNITFETGCEVVVAPMIAANETLVLPKPTRVNHGFVGWYTDAECTQPFEALTSDITLYANWNNILYSEDFEETYDSDWNITTDFTQEVKGDSYDAVLDPTNYLTSTVSGDDTNKYMSYEYTVPGGEFGNCDVIEKVLEIPLTTDSTVYEYGYKVDLNGTIYRDKGFMSLCMATSNGWYVTEFHHITIEDVALKITGKADDGTTQKVISIPDADADGFISIKYRFNPTDGTGTIYASYTKTDGTEVSDYVNISFATEFTHSTNGMTYKNTRFTEIHTRTYGAWNTKAEGKYYVDDIYLKVISEEE